MKLPLPLTLLSTACLTAVAAAQDADSPQTTRTPAHRTLTDQEPAGASRASELAIEFTRTVVPIHTAPADPTGGEYGTWAAGADYKVSFHGDPTFIPYLGEEYPDNQPFTWRTTSATVGGRELVTGKVTRYHTDTRYEYRRDAFTEAYDVLVEGLEQTFVFPRPVGTGDLVVTGELATRLTVERHEGHGPVAFEDASGREILSYGAAFVLDATGRKVAIETRSEGDRIQLVVPGDFLATARYPVVIDPLVGTSTVATHGSAPPSSIDIARDDFGNAIAVAYRRHVSSSDEDAWIRRFTDGFANAPGGDLVFTDINTWGIQNIKICPVGRAWWVAIVNRDFGGTTAIWNRYWVEATSSTTLNTNVTFAGNANNDNFWFGDIGGVEAYDQSGFASAGREAMAVYQVDPGPSGNNGSTSEIWAQRISLDSSGNPTLQTPFQVAGSASVDSEKPSITKVSEGAENNNPVNWIVAYQEYNNTITADDWDVIARQIDANDSASSSIWFGTSTASGGGDDHRIQPKVAGQRGRYVCVYSSLDESGVSKGSANRGREVTAERFDWPYGGSLTRHSPNILNSGSSYSTQRFTVGDVAYDTDNDSHWSTIYHSSATQSIYVERIGFNGDYLELGIIRPPSGSNQFNGGIAYDDDGKRMVVAYGTDEAAALEPVLGDIWAYPTTASPTTSGTSCSPASIDWQGFDSAGNTISPNDQQIGHQFAGVEITNAPAGTFHFLVFGPGTQSLNLTGTNGVGSGCYLNVTSPQVLRSKFAPGNNTFFRLPLPEHLSAGTYHFQDWHLDASLSFFQSTQALSVDLQK